MANKLYEETDIAAIATAIRGKNGSSDTYTVSQMATAITNIPSGGGGSDVANGIIESFKATSGTIDANTFVEFVNNTTAGTDTQLSTLTNSYTYAYATTLSINSVFVTFYASSTLYGVVCTISGTTITAGDCTQLSASNTQYAASVALSSTKVFVAYGGTSNRLYGMVCTISGTTITAGTGTELSTTTDSCNYVSAVLIGSGKVFIAHRNGGYVSGMICTISGTTVTSGGDSLVSSISGSWENISATALNNDKVFVAHRGGSYLYGVVCTISGTTLTAGTDTQLSILTNSYTNMTATMLEGDKVFIAHRGKDLYLYGIVCTISGTTITAGTDTLLTDIPDSYINSTIFLDANKVFIAHRNTGNSYMYGMVCIFSGTSIIIGPDIKIGAINTIHTNTSRVFATLIDTNKVFAAHRGGNSYLYGVVYTIPPLTIAASKTKVNGLVKTTCTSDEEGQVWVLDN